MSAHNQKSAFSSYYHDTWTLLKNYRSVSWSIEVSDYNLQAEFRTEYGCASEAVLDGLEASNSNTHLESYVHSLERSKGMLISFVQPQLYVHRNQNMRCIKAARHTSGMFYFLFCGCGRGFSGRCGW